MRYRTLPPCTIPFLARNGHADRAPERPLLGVKRKYQGRWMMSPFDPQQTSGPAFAEFKKGSKSPICSLELALVESRGVLISSK